MRHNPHFAVSDEGTVRALIEANPWATIVSLSGGELVASHYPVLLDSTADGLTVVTHVGRPDDQVHGLGGSEILVIFAGPHGYISPSWYGEGQAPVPTWNFSVAHCHGVPELLSEDEKLDVLRRLTDTFERHVAQPSRLAPEVARTIARGTLGIRVPISRFTCKVKMSQNKNEATQRGVIAALARQGGPYADPALAQVMRQTLGIKAS